MDHRYVAGLFDGEGWVRIARWEKPNSIHIRWQVLAGIAMTHRPVIVELSEIYGGSVHMMRHDLKNPKHRIQFSWHTGSQIATAFLRRIRPHLIVKRDEVELALELQASIDKFNHKLGHRGGKLHPRHAEIRAHREDLYQRITAAKHVRHDPLTTSEHPEDGYY